MSTNYYFTNSAEERDDPKVHIGKRSAAGAWCDRCGSTLTRDGTQYVHKSSSRQLDACPICYTSRDDFKAACSFTLSMMAHVDTLKELAVLAPDVTIVADEYGRLFTASQMLEIIDDCKMIFQSGSWFS